VPEHTTDSLLVSQALEIAMIYHKGQVDKAGQPYIGHPLRVAGRCNTQDPTMLSIALLHDTVEDTEITLKQIHAVFGAIIGNAVDAISRRVEEPTRSYYRRVKANSLARFVKMADLEDNSDLSRMPHDMLKDEQRVWYDKSSYYHKLYEWLRANDDAKWEL